MTTEARGELSASALLGRATDAEREADALRAEVRLLEADKVAMLADLTRACAAIPAERAAPTPTGARGREAPSERIAKWLTTTFGPSALTDKWERAARVVEEAIELAQAEGLTDGEVIRIAMRVYSRGEGLPSQEAAGVMVTLHAWAACRGVDLNAAMWTEIERIEQPETVKRIREKQAEKAAAGTGKAYALATPAAPQGGQAEGTAPTQAEIDALGVRSVGTCQWCGYYGPGPKHPCPKATPASAPTAPEETQS